MVSSLFKNCNLGTAKSTKDYVIGLPKISDYGYLVSVRNLNNGDFCAGVILTSKLFMTVARCVNEYRKQPSLLTIHAGVSSTQQKWNYVENVRKIHIHYDYIVNPDRSIVANIAILVVNEGVKFGTKDIKPAILDRPLAKHLEGIACATCRFFFI